MDIIVVDTSACPNTDHSNGFHTDIFGNNSVNLAHDFPPRLVIGVDRNLHLYTAIASDDCFTAHSGRGSSFHSLDLWESLLALFSQRKGIQPMEKVLQRESMDDELRNRLWSALKIVVWDRYSAADSMGYRSDDSQNVLNLVHSVWLHYFKQPVDTIPDFQRDFPRSAYQVIREYFFNASWWQVYDFMEYIAKNVEEDWAEDLVGGSNMLLEAESAAYRFVDTEIVEITSEEEITAIEDALGSASNAVREHLTRALALLSDRKHADYRNSIKESISSVESMCQLISGNPKGTLGECLKLLKNKAPIHTALEATFLKLYGYTSDAGGIRHALSDASEQPSFSDAKFMLLACSAFTSFLLGKAAENGIKIGKP